MKGKKNESAEDKNAVFLVVDDDDQARKTVSDYLSAYGYSKILEARDGVEALKVLEKQKVDFIISDWEMPEPNGLDLLRKLKLDPRFSKIPFIMITSPTSQERFKVEDAALSKVDGYIIKPFRSHILREKIEHALVEKQFRERKGVLVVDDDNEVRELVVTYLKQMGYGPIFEAKDGDEGYASLQINHREIAFVVSDWEMPRLTGIDLLAKIRSDAALASIPFVMITSQTSIERLKVKQAIDAEVDHYLLKPFRSEDLRAKVTYVLNKAKISIEVNQLLKVAEGHFRDGRIAEAEKVLQNILLLDPASVRAYLGLAHAQIKLAPQKGLEKAMQFIRRAIAINPQYAQAHIDLAVAFENAMSLEKAIQALKDALKSCSFSAEIHYHLGRLLLRRGREAEGLAELYKAVELKPGYTEASDLLDAAKAKLGMD